MGGGIKTIGVVGVGPVGCILGTHLGNAGAEIVVTDIPRRIAQVKEKGLKVCFGEDAWEHDARAVDSISAMGDYKPDCLIVATKTYVLKEILPDLARTAGKKCLVVAAQNGIGPELEIAKHIPRENVCRMVANYAGGLDEEGVTQQQWFNPPNSFGLLEDREDPRLNHLVELLNSVGFTSEVVSTKAISQKAFLKTILTSALMPLCSVLNLTMSQAMQGKATRRLAADVLREGLEVAERLGFDYGEGIFERCLGYLEKGSNHHPSMTVDLQLKRPTEIDFINGRILEMGQAFDDLNLEVNRIMVSLIMTWEVKNGTRKPEDIPDYVIGHI